MQCAHPCLQKDLSHKVRPGWWFRLACDGPPQEADALLQTLGSARDELLEASNQEQLARAVLQWEERKKERQWMKNSLDQRNAGDQRDPVFGNVNGDRVGAGDDDQWVDEDERRAEAELDALAGAFVAGGDVGVCDDVDGKRRGEIRDETRESQAKDDVEEIREGRSVGIDLGTTNSAVAAIINGNPRILPVGACVT